MHPLNELTDAAAEMAVLIREVDESRLDAPTPCEGRDVRRLINHLIAWSPFIVAVGRREPVSGPPDEKADLTRGDWRIHYLGWLERTTEAWKAESAWEGEVDLGFARVPAAVIGGKALGELVLHGWDLARATGLRLRVSDTVARATRLLVDQTAEETRGLGMYGPPVAVPANASDLDHALGASGRDPRWGG